LKPFIAERYPVGRRDHTLIGSSLGGLFALYALFTRPAAFQRCIAISPAVYWGERTLFDFEAELAASADDLPVNLFLAAGGLEEAHDAEQRFVSNVYELDARLRRREYPSLRCAMQILEGETHMSVFPGAVARGIGQVFGGYRDMHDWSRWLEAAEA
jgi:predicted alpha/beta superfamily hydrolase